MSDEEMVKISEIIPREYKPKHLNRFLKKGKLNFSVRGTVTMKHKEL